MKWLWPTLLIVFGSYLVGVGRIDFGTGFVFGVAFMMIVANFVISYFKGILR